MLISNLSLFFCSVFSFYFFLWPSFFFFPPLIFPSPHSILSNSDSFPLKQGSASKNHPLIKLWAKLQLRFANRILSSLTFTLKQSTYIFFVLVFQFIKSPTHIYCFFYMPCYYFSLILELLSSRYSPITRTLYWPDVKTLFTLTC